MEKLNINTERLLIKEFTEDMAESVHLNSLDDDNRKFVPDEVFETIEDALNTIRFLINCYEGTEGPFVYPVLLKSGENIGYVQLSPYEKEWEVGYHIAEQYTNQGYATEALEAFLPVIMNILKINLVYAICHAENTASQRVLEKVLFVENFRGLGLYQGKETYLIKSVYYLSHNLPQKLPLEKITKNLVLFFSHKLSDEQINCAKSDLQVTDFIYLPENLQRDWSNISPESDNIDISGFVDWIEKNTSKNDIFLVQGDFGATFSLLNYLKTNNYSAVYSTSKRIAFEYKKDNGDIVTTHIFKHIKFRFYY